MSVDMTIRPMTKTEQMYTYTQSTQIQGQTGCIGHLRADMDTDGNGFFSSWDDHRGYLKTDEFKAEFDEVINALRFNEEYGGVLKNRNSLAKYCYSQPESAFGNDREFGFRADTEKHSYMMRLNPNKGEYQLYCYCYRRDWLDQHMKNAERGIRFIDSNYNNLFKVPDGGRIKITYQDGEVAEKTARYIDEYHAEIGGGSCNLFHICEWAERMENINAKVEPIDQMPEVNKVKDHKMKGEAR